MRFAVDVIVHATMDRKRIPPCQNREYTLHYTVRANTYLSLPVEDMRFIAHWAGRVEFAKAQSLMPLQSGKHRSHFVVIVMFVFLNYCEKQTSSCGGREMLASIRDILLLLKSQVNSNIVFSYSKWPLKTTILTLYSSSMLQENHQKTVLLWLRQYVHWLCDGC